MYEIISFLSLGTWVVSTLVAVNILEHVFIHATTSFQPSELFLGPFSQRGPLQPISMDINARFLQISYLSFSFTYGETGRQ